MDPKEIKDVYVPYQEGPPKSYEKIIVKKGVISRITIDDSKTSNALSLQTQQEMVDALADMDEDPKVRVVILDGKGTISFSGHDIAEVMPLGLVATHKRWRFFMESFAKFYKAVWNFRKMLIMKIDGRCVAGGMDLSCFCDLVYCSDKAFFTWFPISMVPCAVSPSQALAWRIGLLKANGLMFSEGWTAEEAEKNGLVNKVVPAEELEDFVMEKARLISEHVPEALRMTKYCQHFIWNRLGVEDGITLGSEMDILAHLDEADQPFQEIMRTQGVRGVVMMAKKKVEALGIKLK